MNKILRILISFARAERVVALNQVVHSDFVVILTIRASRSFQSRTKTKNFLAFPFKTAGGAGGSRKKLKGNFMVLFSSLPLQINEKRKELFLLQDFASAFCDQGLHNGLFIFFNFGFVTCVYTCVVRILLCPKSSCTYRTSVPFSSKCVAKEWRSE